MPSFKGGDINKFREWVMRRTNYPQAAVDNRIEGKVYLTFIVETDGTVTNVTVVRELILSLIMKLSGLFRHHQNGARSSERTAGTRQVLNVAEFCTLKSIILFKHRSLIFLFCKFYYL